MGEYEPRDSRNVTGAGNQMGQNQGGSSAQQGGQQQQFQQGGGQMGGSGEAGGQMGGGQPSTNRFAGQIREHMAVIGADGVHVGTVDAVVGERIKLTRKDSSAGFAGERHEGHHHYLPLAIVAGIEGDTVRLSAQADVAWTMEEEE